MRSGCLLNLLVPVLEKAMAPHSSSLAWRIPQMEEPGGLPSLGSHRVGHDWSDLAAAAAALPVLSTSVYPGKFHAVLMTSTSYTFLFYSNLQVREGIGHVGKRWDWSGSCANSWLDCAGENHNHLGKLIKKIYKPRLFPEDFGGINQGRPGCVYLELFPWNSDMICGEELWTE